MSKRTHVKKCCYQFLVLQAANFAIFSFFKFCKSFRAHKRICCSLAWLPILLLFVLIIALLVRTFTVSERCNIQLLETRPAIRQSQHPKEVQDWKKGEGANLFLWSGSSLPHCQRRSRLSSIPTMQPNYFGRTSWGKQFNTPQSRGKPLSPPSLGH